MTATRSAVEAPPAEGKGRGAAQRVLSRTGGDVSQGTTEHVRIESFRVGGFIDRESTVITDPPEPIARELHGATRGVSGLREPRRDTAFAGRPDARRLGFASDPEGGKDTEARRGSAPPSATAAGTGRVEGAQRRRGTGCDVPYKNPPSSRAAGERLAPAPIEGRAGFPA